MNQDTETGGGEQGDAVAGNAVAQGEDAANSAGTNSAKVAGSAAVDAAGAATVAGSAAVDAAGAATVAGSATEGVMGAGNAGMSAAERYRALPRGQDGHITTLSSEEHVRRITADTSDLLAHLADLKINGDELVQEVKGWYADTEDDPVFMLAHTPKRLRGRVRAYMRQKGAKLDMTAPIPVSVATLLEATAANAPEVGAGGDSRGAEVGAAEEVAETVGAEVNAAGAIAAETDATTPSTPAVTDKQTDVPGAGTQEIGAAGGQTASESARAAGDASVAPYGPSPKLDANSSTYARQSLAKLYTSNESRYSGRSEQSFTLWEKSLKRNMALTGCGATDALATLHVAVDGVALRQLMSCLDDTTTLEGALEHLRRTFVSAAAKRKAHTDFLALDFLTFRSSRSHISEVDAVNDFHTYAASLQEQLGESYATDVVLRDRLMQVFSFSKRIAEAFHDTPPATTADLIARVAARASRTAGKDLLGEPVVSDVNWAHNRQRRTTDYRVRGGSRGGRHMFRSNRNRNAGDARWSRGNHRTSKRACWVCGSFQHFARDVHTREEITKALSQGQNVAAFCALIPADLAAEVMHSELLSTGDSDGNNGGAGDDDGDADGGGENVEADAIFEDPDGPDPEQDTYVSLALTPSSDDHEGLDSEIFNAYVCKVLDNPIVGLAAEGYVAHLSEELQFRGAYIDTGCVGSSIISESQYRAYCAATLCPYSIDERQVGRVNFGGTTSRNSLGKAMIGVFISCSDETIWVSAHVIPSTQTPFLLSRNDLDLHQIDIRTLSRTLVHRGKTQSLPLIGGFLVIQWEYNMCLFTEAELHRIHRAFAHRGSEAVYKTLKTAYPETSPADKAVLEKIESECGPCQLHARAPGHFRISSAASAGKFNYCVEADPFFIEGQSVMHLKCRGINLVEAAACGTGAAEIWAVVRRKWIYRYGPMSILRVDQALDTSVLRNGCNYYGIHLDPVPTEAPWRVGAVERSHKILKTSYAKLHLELKGSVSREELLELCCYSINITVTKGGPSPYHALYGTSPRVPVSRAHDTPDNSQRIRAVNLARKQLETLSAKHVLNRALGSKPPYVDELEDIQVGDLVLIYRRSTTSSSWEGPVRLVEVSPTDVTILSSSGNRSKLDRTQVKPWKVPSTAHSEQQTAEFSAAHATRVIPPDEVNPAEFKESRLKEVNGLLAQGAFKVVPRSSVPPSARIFGSRFVDSIKNYDKPGEEFKKSRLVIQCYEDADKHSLVTASPSVSRLGLRIILALAASKDGLKGYGRDITQAYLLSEQIQRKVFCAIPAELGLGPDKCWQLVKPVYGVPEAGNYWHSTYDAHHKKLGFKKTDLDPCLYFRLGSDGELKGLVGMLVDDTIIFADEDTEAMERSAAERFPHKTTKPIQSQPMDFNGLTIKKTEEGYEIDNARKIAMFERIDSAEHGSSVKAKGLFVATSTRPDLLSRVQCIDATTGDERTIVKLANRMVTYAKATAEKVLRFVPLDLKNDLRVVCFTDAAFNVDEEHRSQLGAVICLVDVHDVANILHYFSRRSKRVTRSVFGAELFALSDGFDVASAITSALRLILPNVRIALWGVIDSRTVFNSIVRSNPVTEKRLMTDVSVLREAHLECELEKLFWCPGSRNAADPLSKVTMNEVFERLLTDNKLVLDPAAWTEDIKSGIK